MSEDTFSEVVTHRLYRKITICRCLTNMVFALYPKQQCYKEVVVYMTIYGSVKTLQRRVLTLPYTVKMTVYFFGTFFQFFPRQENESSDRKPI